MENQPGNRFFLHFCKEIMNRNAHVEDSDCSGTIALTHRCMIMGAW